MGISTVASYRGAQVFEAIGLAPDVVDRYFTGTTSKLGGVGLDVIAEEVARRHAIAYPPTGISPAHRRLDVGGEYQWRREGEPHLFDPETVFRLQHATREGRYDIFKQYTARVDEQSERLMTLRGLFRFKDGVRAPVPIDEVEPVSEIVKRFSTGAMSYGSISQRGARDPRDRDEPARRQVEHRRGRRGPRALRPAAQRRLQALGDQAGRVRPLRRHERVPRQRRRPPDQDGAGRQARRGRPAARPQGLPVDREDAALDAGRRPDLAAAAPRHLLDRGPRAAHPRPQERQPAGPRAREAGVRGRRRHRRRRRGQGARRRRPRSRATTAAPAPRRSPRSSTRARPWELGLAETQQTLLLNGLRDRVVVQTDGQLKTGRDVVIAALLGAEEFGFATAPLVVMRLRDDARLPPRHLPGRRRDAEPGAARAVQRASRSSSRPSSSTSPRRCASTSPRSASARIDEAIGHAEVLDTRRGESALEGRGSRPRADPATCPSCPRAPRAATRRRRTTASTRRSTTS